MRILFYIPELKQEDGGIRQYSAAMLQLLAADRDNEYYILHNNEDPVILSIIQHNPVLKLVPHRIGKERRIEKLFTDMARALNFMFWRVKIRKRLPTYHFVQRIARKYKIDIIHCPYQYTPYSKAKTICTLHDVQDLHFPAYFSTRARIERGLQVDEMQERADAILVSYQHVKNDLVLFYQTPPSKITVCLLDMSNLWIKKYQHTALHNLTPSYQVKQPFLLYPANTWPHKNHERLIESLKYIKDTWQEDILVVCTGDTTEHYKSVLRPLIKKYSLEDNIIFAGVVNEDTLFYLYQTALGVVVPTTYEAGSFPLMESMLLGIPVICADVTSLPETVGDPRFIFDPFNIRSMAESIYELWHSSELRKASIKNSESRRIFLKNTGALEKITGLYKSLHNK